MPAPQLQLYRASRLEYLAAQLIDLLEATTPADAFAAREIVIAHPGLGRWLRQAIATRCGVAANLDLVQPWQWLSRLQNALLGDATPTMQRYEREAMRWQLFDLLGDRTLDPALDRYLDGAETERRRFQLADRLAAVFVQYLIYRRDWLLAWERGSTPHWQARLWRRLVERNGPAHRAARMHEMSNVLATPGAIADDGCTIVFGVSHLPPDVLGVLRALAQHQPVHVLYPDPCHEHWLDIASERRIVAAGMNAEALHLDIGHPLLAALGSQGQEFLQQLAPAAADAYFPDALDADAAVARGLLGELQQSIRTLQPDLCRSTDPHDATLRVHVCHTRLRELEVLRDALLDRLVADPTLQPRDIVVMAPDIAAYAALIPAVFGDRPEPASTALPWQLADQPLLQAHPLLGAFQRLLGLDRARFTASEIGGLLDVPALARRFGLDDESRRTLRRWIARSHVAWALDEHMRADSGAPARRENTWAFGIDRLSLGYLLGETDESRADVLALAGAEGIRAESLGVLAELLGVLGHVRHDLGSVQRASAWSEWLRALVERLFENDRDDSAESAAHAALLHCCSDLADHTEIAGIDPLLAWPAVREFLGGQLDAIPEPSRGTGGGLLFCGMVPYRTIPFRLVAVLGLNDGEFPRRATRNDLNLMSAPSAWRSGDRDTRDEDRYLFLEALMAARDALHVSYVGEDAQDGRARNPAAPLQELMRFLPRGDTREPAWLVRHALHPFDARYFDRSDPRLFTFRGDPPPMLDAASAAARDAETHTVEPSTVRLTDLERFLRNPAQSHYLRALNLRFASTFDDSTPDEEPLDAALSPRERVEARLFWRALAEDTNIPAQPPEWLALSGVMPHGAVGRIAYANARDCATKALDALREAAPDLHGAPQQIDVSLTLADGARLEGRIGDVYPSQRRLVFSRGREPRVTDMLVLRLRQAVLVAATATAWRAIAAPPFEGTRDPCEHWGDDATHARAVIERVVALYHRAVDRPPLFFPQTSWAWWKASQGKAPDTALTKARASWLPGDYSPTGASDSEDPYFALAAAERHFLDPADPAHAEFVLLAELLCGALVGGAE